MFRPAAIVLGLLIFGLIADAAMARCPYRGGKAVLPMPGAPFAVQPAADGCWLFVSLLSEAPGGVNGLAVLRSEDGGFRLSHLVPTQGEPGGLALSHDGAVLVIAAWDRVLLYDAARLIAGSDAALLGVVPQKPGAGSVYAAFSRDDRLLFVSQEREERLLVIDMVAAIAGKQDASVVGAIPQGRAPVGLALSPDGARLYATSQVAPDGLGLAKSCPTPGGGGDLRPPGVLSVVDVARAATDPAGSLMAQVAAGCGPVRVALSGDGSVAWVTARGEDRLLAFATARLDQPPAPLAVGPAPVGVAVRPDGRQVWVANSNRFVPSADGSLSRIIPGRAGATTVASGRFPREMRFLPDGVTLVVTQFGASALQFEPTDHAGVAERSGP